MPNDDEALQALFQRAIGDHRASRLDAAEAAYGGLIASAWSPSGPQPRGAAQGPAST